MMFFKLAGVLTLLLIGVVSSRGQAPAPHAHVVNTFTFAVDAPMAQVAPLFAPEAERRWAGDDWNPTFLYPVPGRDVQGAVWTLPHGPHTSVWVNTLFDVAAGRMQYVVFIPEHVVTTIDVRVTAASPTRTSVSVTYTRTAVDPAANDYVEHLGQNDRNDGPDWKKGVEHALGINANK